MDCIFCKIIAKHIPSKIEFEDDLSVVIQDLHPKSKIHLLIVPKKHISTIAEAHDDDDALLGHLTLVARDMAAKLGLNGYKLQYNVGKEGGQEIFHIHMHLLG